MPDTILDYQQGTIISVKDRRIPDEKTMLSFIKKAASL